jgi:hypothetical protein
MPASFITPSTGRLLQAIKSSGSGEKRDHADRQPVRIAKQVDI